MDVERPAGASSSDQGVSLWHALAHQLFNETTRTPGVLRQAIAAMMMEDRSRPDRTAKFLARHGVTPQQYTAELAAGQRQPGLLEASFVAYKYGVQILVHVASSPALPPLLFYKTSGRFPRARKPSRPVLSKVYALALVDGPHTFRSVVRAPSAVSWGDATVHRYDLSAGEPRGSRPVPPPPSRKRDLDEAGPSSGGKGKGKRQI